MNRNQLIENAAARLLVGVTKKSTPTCTWYQVIKEDAIAELTAALEKTPRQYYIAPVFGCVEPQSVEGPFDTFHAMLEQAKKVKAEQSETDALFYIVQQEDGRPCLECFANSHFND
jgi:hypothetical protein